MVSNNSGIGQNEIRQQLKSTEVFLKISFWAIPLLVVSGLLKGDLSFFPAWFPWAVAICLLLNAVYFFARAKRLRKLLENFRPSDKETNVIWERNVIEKRMKTIREGLAHGEQSSEVESFFESLETTKAAYLEKTQSLIKKSMLMESGQESSRLQELLDELQTYLANPAR